MVVSNDKTGVIERAKDAQWRRLDKAYVTYLHYQEVGWLKEGLEKGMKPIKDTPWRTQDQWSAHLLSEAMPKLDGHPVPLAPQPGIHYRSGGVVGVNLVAGGSLAMTVADPPVGVTTTRSPKMGGEAQLVVAEAGVVPQSGPPLLRVRPTRGSSAEAEAVALSRVTQTNVNEPSGPGLMDEAVDGGTECMERGGASQLQFPTLNLLSSGSSNPNLVTREVWRRTSNLLQPWTRTRRPLRGGTA